MIYRVDIIDQGPSGFGVYLTEDDGRYVTGIAQARSKTEPRGAQIRAWLAAKGFEVYGDSRVVGDRTLRTMVRRTA
ncbi:hypothetical protein [Micromonospora sp. NPDC047730]|uniref:hypothetical protein n=1 Tax=Micromonospora sp. NPDC047730 TaxID=3364253 RepID=UPI0037163593